MSFLTDDATELDNPYVFGSSPKRKYSVRKYEYISSDDLQILIGLIRLIIEHFETRDNTAKIGNFTEEDHAQRTI